MKMNEKNCRNSTTRSSALTSLLAAQGLLEDQSIPDEERRKAQQERLQKLYHNTRVLLSHYREIAWVLECFPETVAQELEEPFENLDTLLDRMDAEAWKIGSWNPGWKACGSPDCCWIGSTMP